MKIDGVLTWCQALSHVVLGTVWMSFREVKYLPKVTHNLIQPTHVANFQCWLSCYVFINSYYLWSPCYTQDGMLLLRNARKSILPPFPKAAFNQQLSIVFRWTNSKAEWHVIPSAARRDWAPWPTWRTYGFLAAFPCLHYTLTLQWGFMGSPPK